MANTVCADCIREQYLSEMIRQEGISGHCDACDKRKLNTISIERLGEILARVIQKHYETGVETPRFYDDSDKPSWEQNGEDISFIVQEVLGQCFDFNEEIGDAVISSEHCDVQHGEVPFFDDETKYEEKPTRPYTYSYAWTETQQELLTRRRFFSPSAKSLFDNLFQDVDKLLTSDAPANEKPRVVSMMPAGTVVFRGRMCDSSKSAAMLQEPYKQVGPPPPQATRAGRMNAEGIPVFYGALDIATCLAELRPALGTEAAVISVETTSNVRLLDFTRIQSAYRSLSYFQPDFSDQASRLAFIRQLAKLICRPIVPGHESQYVITQTMMEYLAHVHTKPFDGVLFNSSQKEGGKNIVLFPKNSNDEVTFQLRYVEKSIRFFRTAGITYEHKSLDYRL
jgi:hypothetical protein